MNKEKLVNYLTDVSEKAFAVLSKDDCKDVEIFTLFHAYYVVYNSLVKRIKDGEFDDVKE